MLAHDGPQAAADLIRAELAKAPTLIGLDRLLEAQLEAAPPDRRHDLELVKALVGQHIKRLGMYRCEHCALPRAAVLLALPRLPAVGNLFAEAHRGRGAARLAAMPPDAAAYP